MRLRAYRPLAQRMQCSGEMCAIGDSADLRCAVDTANSRFGGDDRQPSRHILHTSFRLVPDPTFDRIQAEVGCSEDRVQFLFR